MNLQTKLPLWYLGLLSLCHLIQLLVLARIVTQVVLLQLMLLSYVIS